MDKYVEIADSILRPGARRVERVGDELLIVAADARTALETALALRAVLADEPLFPTIRAGIHGGKALERKGRYFGFALNLQ